MAVTAEVAARRTRMCVFRLVHVCTRAEHLYQNMLACLLLHPCQDGIEKCDDDLDCACLEHDRCLCAGETDEELLQCDYDLRSAAQQIYNDYNQCTGLSQFNPFCSNDGIVCGAQSTVAGMTAKIDGGIQRSSNNCDCVKHQDKPSCSASLDYEDSSSGDYDYEDSSSGDYDYEDSSSGDDDYIVIYEV